MFRVINPRSDAYELAVAADNSVIVSPTFETRDALYHWAVTQGWLTLKLNGFDYTPNLTAARTLRDKWADELKGMITEEKKHAFTREHIQKSMLNLLSLNDLIYQLRRMP